MQPAANGSHGDAGISGCVTDIERLIIAGERGAEAADHLRSDVLSWPR